MNLKIHLPNAVKLLLLLFLLFWSFTWNLPADFDVLSDELYTSHKETGSKDVSCGLNSDISCKNGKLIESDRPKMHESGKLDKTFSPSNILIPSFNEWRKLEMEKHEKTFAKDKMPHLHRNVIGRKLNYASSKCGAKVLASNPEARHRMAVLSEKSDEYFLNPCRVRTWFVIELCDAVEATQVELANYELYSSSPKEFSIYSSEVYPTFFWHHLGTFVAEDKRSMQTFNVSEKTMGKFIKIIIHSHHGKEHYCPLSVIRVLGYSMVETFEDIEMDERNEDSDIEVQNDANIVTSFPKMTEYHNIDKKVNADLLRKPFYRQDICDKLFTYCSSVSTIKAKYVCLNQPVCQFLKEIVIKLEDNCLKFYSPRFPELFFIGFNSTTYDKQKSSSLTSLPLESVESKKEFNGHSEIQDIIMDYEHKKYLRIKKECDFHTSIKLKEINSKDEMRSCDTLKKIQKCQNDIPGGKLKPLYDRLTQTPQKCMHDLDKSEIETFKGMKLNMKRNFATEEKRNGDDIDSAGLISKESVLFKLASKIKNSEIELNLINKYLQQLSESYRYQIEEMKMRLNKTFEEMTKTTEKTTIVNVKQEQSIIALKGKIEVLNRKIIFLTKGKKDLTKTVIELHGFFLILEIIILATVFNIFLNIFKRKNTT